ncbi:MAG TPA: transcriptional regulator [Novosphingobium sp.]|nr:transcriptional regulator [Novosphingobium sp.]
MSRVHAASVAECPIVDIKLQSGRKIEEARKRYGITQQQFARDSGMGVRWLREIEAGNPRSRLDDHLICSYLLDLSTGHIVIPLLFAGQKMSFPRQLATGDLSEFERMCIEVISERNLDHLTRALTPVWLSTPGETGVKI